jgi:uncharacterized protein (DUF885 family)
MLGTVKTFSALTEEFVECVMRLNPVTATEVGIHDYDHKLPDDSPDGFRERSSWMRDLEQRLVASVPWEELPPAQRIDYALLRSRIASMRADLEEIKVHAHNPTLYPELALRGLHLLLMRPFAPLEERKEAILGRMMAIPDYLSAAQANLTKIPELYIEMASEVTATGPEFVDGAMQMLREHFPGEAERIEEAARRARMGFAQYQDFLDHEAKKRVGGTFAIGERWMNFKLEREHLLTMNCAALESFGREHIERTRGALEQEAKKIDAGKTWRDLVEDARRRHPEPAKLREAYVAETARARRFVEEKRLAPLPSGSLEIIDTPLFERPMTPYAAYLQPGPFDEDTAGYFYVTPVDTGRKKDEQEEQIRRHNYVSLSLAVVHEAWPGHHLQLLHAVGAGSRLRRLADSPVFAEGWALYCEELMLEQGFFMDPLARLYQLKELQMRACRVVIDVGLHTGTMSFDDAVRMLVEEAMVERANAVAEVKRYCYTPTQPMSYLVGKQQIIEIRDEVRSRLGKRFNLHDFHKALLGCGTVPPALARMELEEQLRA